MLARETCLLIRDMLWGSTLFRESYLMVRDVVGAL
jgi:hypothetical protein